ncbi:24066_t:CDS:10, partial [Dentiscutata erythropus]
CWHDDPGKRPKIDQVMHELRETFEKKLEQFKAFYSAFCPPNKVLDSTLYSNDTEEKLKKLSQSQHESLPSQYLENHEDIIMKAAEIYEFTSLKTFTNIYEMKLKRITDNIQIDYVVNTLIPAVRVTDIKTELDLINRAVYLSKSNRQDLENALKHLTAIPKWDERLQKLSTIVEIFKVPLKTEDWLGRSLKFLREDFLILGKIVEFMEYVKDHNPDDNEKNYWSLIKELSSASELLEFLQAIAEHDIKNLINGVDDYYDERLIQEDTMSLFIQVKQLVVQLMNRSNKIDKFLELLRKISQQDSSLPNKIIICANFNMALQTRLRNISNREKVTKEKIQNAVLRGTYTFEKDDRSDKFNITLVYQARGAINKIIHNMSGLQNLRGLAQLIAKPTNISTDLRKIINEFVSQVDTAQEILNVGSKLIQMRHFGYRQFKKKIIGTEERFGTTDMRDLLAKLKADLQNWKMVVDKAQEEHYYLTFFPARYILAFYDYFTSGVQDRENTEICRTLIKFVNSKAELPSREDCSGISCNDSDYSCVLNEIGKKLRTIFRNLLKTSHELKIRGERIISDVVNRELNIFIKRSFFAAKNGYREKLFSIANLELLEFELQYDLVESIRSMCDKYNDYLLALVYYHGGSFHHHILDQFSQDVHSTNGLNAETMKAIYHDLCSNVTCVSSELSGQGKTEWIKQANLKEKKILHDFLISDGANYESLIYQLKDRKIHPTESLHINIMSAENPNEINLFLFELLTLGFVSNNIYMISLPRIPIFIEVATTVNQELLNSLPIASYLIKEHLSWSIRNLNVSSEICDPIQIVCNYLDAHEKHEINERDIIFHGQGFITKPLSDKRCQDLIVKYFLEGNSDSVTSFRYIEIFTSVLADQLICLSSSTYLTVENLKSLINEETLLRTTLFESLIEVSKKFAFRSINAELCDDRNSKSKIVQWDIYDHIFIFFRSQNPDSICALYREKKTVPENVKEFLKIQSMIDPDKWELEDYNCISPKLLLERLECLARRTTHKIDLPLYALSVDNLVKMALILLRARAAVPVVIMGEAGCGKSSLIGFLAKVVEVNYEPFNLHAGIKEQDILDFMDKAQIKADIGELWLFFDEINTCNHIGLLANIIAHRTFNGNSLHPNIRLFSACNPYRKRIKVQSQAGIKTRARRYEELSNLVYQVKPLPDQILDYVWDYGVLFPNDEKRYIQVMVQTRFGEGHELFTELLFTSQQFIRLIEENYSVSLRDVKRAIKLVSFFGVCLRARSSSGYLRGNKHYPSPDGSSRISLQIRCYILALGLCYQSRIYDQESRSEYRQEIIKVFQRHKMNIKESDFTSVIRDEQDDWVKRMELPPNTVMNEALLENVLVMVVCILTKIPVFIIGATGSSKSLAIKLIGQNLRGSDSSDIYFRIFPQVYFISHQGSSSSTSDGIIKVFDQAINYQESSSVEFPVISVVVFDGIELAETSPHNPLKVLHTLLEPNYPSDGQQFLSPKFGIEDLVDIAVRLLDSKLHTSISRASLRSLAKAYVEYEEC